MADTTPGATPPESETVNVSYTWHDDPAPVGSAALNIAEAWLARAERAREDFLQAAMAHRLFKPEWSERAGAEFQHAMTWAKFWQGQVAS